MPLFKTIIINPKTHVKIWKITESYANLLQPLQLKPESLERVLGMKSTLHQRGFLSVRHLLRAFGYTDADLYYDANGKPHLKDGKFISITHSFEFSAVIIGEAPVGIDIEKIRPKIANIATKFLGYEWAYLHPNTSGYINKLSVIWCVKESLYKLFNTKGMLFKSHFLVIPFEMEHQQTIAWVDYQDIKYRYTATFIEFEGFCCAYALPT